MNTDKLLEMNMLFAAGLLDDAERESFEAAYADATPEVQAHIRDESRRMADLGDLVQSESPRPELREIILAAVRAAMHEKANDQRIATERAIAGTITAHGANSARPNYTQPKLTRSPRVHRVWRGTSIGLAAAIVAMVVVSVNVQQTYNSAGKNAFIANLYDGYGGQFLNDTMFNPNTQRVVLATSGNDSSMMGASVFSNPDWDSARLMVKNIRPQQGDEEYRLVVLDAEGNIVREVTTFTSTGEIESFDIQINLNTETRLAIYQGMAEDILNAEPLMTTVDSEM
ncbi:MAG: hypothetical protein JKY96_06070 [Phycisphaerales bacterium]|nr:hypothetical protein [Phycisphaerales bacterium]